MSNKLKKTIAIAIKDLSVSFEDRSILKSADVTIEEGEFVFIVGPNGSGKSTLIKSILGLIDIDGGEIEVFGQKNTQENVASNFGYVPQHAHLDRDFPITVEEVINLECESGGECHSSIGEHLQYLNSTHLLKRKIAQLSGGEMQKVLIMRGLVRDPKVIVLDEPTSNLDTESHKDFHSLLKDLNKKGKTIIFISHDLNVVNKLATKVLYLYEHEVVVGEKETILEKYKDLFDEHSNNHKGHSHGHH